MSELIRPEIKALSAYHVADAGNMIKLDAMENPYPMPDDLLAKWLQQLSHAALNRYPDPQAAQLRNKLRAYMQVPAGQDIILGGDGDDSLNGNGGTDTIAGQQGNDVIVDPAAEIKESFTLSAAIISILNAT